MVIPSSSSIPPLTLYLNAAVYLVVFFVLLLFGQVGSYGEFINLYLSKTLIQWPIAVPSYLPGHILTAAFSVVAVLCVLSDSNAVYQTALDRNRSWGVYGGFSAMGCAKSCSYSEYPSSGICHDSYMVFCTISCA